MWFRISIPYFMPWLVACLLVLFSSAACAGAAPMVPEGGGESEAVPEVYPTEVVQPTTLPSVPTPLPTQLPAIQEARWLTLEWPMKIRKGDSDVVRLRLEVDDLGGVTPTAVIAGHTTKGETVYIPDLYETHTVLAESRLDIAGLDVEPAGLLSQSLLKGQPVTFFWSVSPKEVGKYRGTVWFNLRFIPKDGSPPSERTISAQVIEIDAVNLLGLGGQPARLLGGLGAVLGTLLGLEDVISILKKMIFRRKI